MTLPASIRLEAEYRREERLGILCGSDEPTEEQRKIADRDFWRVVAMWKNGTLQSDENEMTEEKI